MTGIIKDERTGIGMGNNALRRGFGAAVLGAAAGMLALPGTALAGEGPDPIIANDCAATLAGGQGTPLTADAGALAQAPGMVTVGLGSESDGTNGHPDPLLALPVSDTLDGLGVTSTPVVSAAATGACEVAKPLANDVGAAVQSILPYDDVTGSAQAQVPGPPADGDPPSATTPGDVSSAASASSPIVVEQGFGGLREFSASDIDELFAGLPAIALPPAAVIGPPVRAPDLNTPDSTGKDLTEQSQESGTVAAVPASAQQDRLPLLLAVAALAVVTTLLSRRLYQGKSA